MVGELVVVVVVVDHGQTRASGYNTLNMAEHLKHLSDLVNGRQGYGRPSKLRASFGQRRHFFCMIFVYV